MLQKKQGRVVVTKYHRNVQIVQLYWKTHIKGERKKNLMKKRLIMVQEIYIDIKVKNNYKIKNLYQLINQKEIYWIYNRH